MRPERLFVALARWSVRRPRTVLGLAVGLALLSLLATGGRLELRTSNLDLVDPDLPAVRRFVRFAEEFGTPNILVAVFEGGDREELAAAVDRAAPRLRRVAGVRGVLDRRPVDEAVRAATTVDPYFSSLDGGLFFVFVQPDDWWSRADTVAPFVAGVRAALDSAGLEASAVRVGLTGLPQYALDDRDVIQRDISRLSLLGLALVLSLFFLAFGAFRRPALAALTVIVAVAWTLGLTAFYPGHLTLLSAFFASILLGLGIDFGIHLVDRVEEELAAGAAAREAIVGAVRSLARSFGTSSLTTASVFFAMRYCGFRGFAELGFISGAGVLLCLLAMLTVLPALLTIAGPGAAAGRRLGRRRLGRALVRMQSPWLAGALVLLCAAGLAAGLPSFDDDYLNLQPRGSEAVRLERLMVRASDYSPQFAAFTVAGAEAARALVDRLHQEETVAAVRSALDIDMQAAMAGEPSPEADALRRMMVGASGALAVYAYPMDDVWSGGERRSFLRAMRAVDPDVTGMPFLGDFMVARSRRALEITAALAIALLLIWVVADFRHWRPALLAVVPTFCALAALGGLLRLLGLSFNPLNVMALPVVIGIAVDDGVHMVHRFEAEAGSVCRTLVGTGRGILLTSLTTMAAFGALAFTSHRGLASFAAVLTLGVGSALLFSTLLLPALLGLERRRRMPRAAAEISGA